MKAVALLLFVGLLVAPAIAMSRDLQSEAAAEEVDAAEAEDALVEVSADTEEEGVSELESDLETANEVDADTAAMAEGAAVSALDAEVAAEADAEAEFQAEAQAEAETGAASNCMTVAGLNMVKSFEGFYPKEYKDVAGIPTIGYGTLCSDNLIKCPGPVTEAQAAAVLGADLLKKYGPCVAKSVKYPLTNNQYSALVSFAYNAGCGALDTVAKQNKLNQASGANLAGVTANMAKYNKARVKGVLTTVKGLTNRRNAEIALFKNAAASSCMATPTGTAAPVLKSGAPQRFPLCAALKGTCQTGHCAGTIVHNKCGAGAATCCVPKAAAAPAKPTPAPTPSPAPSTGSNCMSVAGLNMVKSFEGFYAKEYKDVAGIPTIGYGTLCSDNLIQCPGPVSEAQAAAVLGADLLKKYSGCVRAAVKAPLNNNQYSALVSFAYNAGCGAAANVAKAARLNQPSAAAAQYRLVAGRMALYNKARVKGVLTVVKGLVRRRAAEGALFNSNANAQCMPAPVPVLKSGAPLPAVKAEREARRRRHRREPLTAHKLFNLRRGEVDLPSGTHITTAGIPNATHKRIVAKADIARAVRSHHNGHRKNRGPVGKWSEHLQHTARVNRVPVLNQ